MGKRIGFVSNQGFVPWGGSEELWQQAAIRMAGMGYEVGASVFDWRELEVKEVKDLEKNKVKVSRRKKSPSLLEKVLKNILPGSIKDGTEGLRWLKKFKPDLIVITDVLPKGRMWMELCRKAGIPYAIIIQLADEKLWPYEKVGDLPNLYYSAKAVYFLCEHNRKVAVKQLAIDLPNAVQCFNPFKVKYREENEWPEEKGIFKLACVARLGIEHKRQDLILEIMNMPKWRERNISVSLFGNGGHKEFLERLISYWKLKNVSIMGFSNNIQEIWSQHHALILPSTYEGVPLAMVEAMLSNRVPIVTNAGGNGEIVEDNVSGFVAESATLKLVEETLERAWARREEWEQIGKKAGERIRQIVPEDPVQDLVEKLITLL